MMFLWKMNIVLGNIAQQGKHASVDSYNCCRTVFLSVAYFHIPTRAKNRLSTVFQ